MIYEDKLRTLKDCLEESNNNLLTDLIYYLAKVYLGESYDESEYYDIKVDNLINDNGITLATLNEIDALAYRLAKDHYSTIREIYFND